MVKDHDVDYLYNKADWVKPTPSTSHPSGSKPRSDQSFELSEDDQDAQPCSRFPKTGKGKGIKSVDKLLMTSLPANLDKVTGRINIVTQQKFSASIGSAST